MTEYARIASDHAILRLIIDRLRVLAAAPIELLTPSRWRALWTSELDMLRRMLKTHFSYEEADGYLVQVVDLVPNTHARVAMLQSQHTEMLMGLDELIETVEEAGLESTARRVGELLHTLAEHETAETDLIQDVLLTDAGPSD